MVFTKRARYIRRAEAPQTVLGPDPECAITAGFEGVASLLATAAAWFAPAPLPALPPRRARARPGRRAAPSAFPAHLPADRLTTRSA
jgi:hypothetical protein